MNPRLIGAIVAVAGVVLAFPASAVRPEVEEAEQLYEDLRYGPARRAFEAALALDGNRADDLASIYLHLGILAGARNNEDAAQEHFQRALAVDHDIDLPRGLPPKITEPFARARLFWGDERTRVDHQSPRSWVIDTEAELLFELVDDRMELATGLRISLWREGEEDSERSYLQEGGGPYAFSIPTGLLQSEGVLHYRIELLGEHAAVLFELSAAEDLSVAVTGEADDEGEDEEHEGRPIYRRWWFWTAIGAVVLGVTVGSVVGVSLQDDGIAFGSPEVVR